MSDHLIAEANRHAKALTDERNNLVKDAIARAEAAETVALANWNGALERAMKAEADLAALEQCHDDNCRAVVKIAAELTTLTAERDQLRALLVHADQILDDIDTCSDAHKPMYSSYSQNVFKLCVKGRDARRAAIAASMKEDAK